MSLTDELLAWHARTARALPWRGEKDAYRVWLSEVMLQQTRAQTVIPYYHAFLEAFPNVYALAEAPQERVLKMWEGLGYYSRARSLQRAAQRIAETYGGRLPSDEDSLRTLPGVGEYTAAAVASIAFGKRALALDGNALRVFSRVFDIREDVSRPETRRRIAEAAYPLLPEEAPGEFNQAIMGLGNLVCTRSPRCEDCPVRSYCAARREGVAASLPVKAAKPEKRVERRAVALAFGEGGVLVRRRPQTGLLAGLWEFPNVEGDEAACREALGAMGVAAGEGALYVRARHVFTHLVWEMQGVRFDGAHFTGERSDGAFFADAEALAALAMPTALRVYRQAALEELENE